MSTRNRVARAPRRRVVWADTLLDTVVSSGSKVAPSLHTGILTENFDLTVTRIIVGLTLSPETLLAVQSQMQFDIGIGIVGQEAFASGAIPNPDTAGDVPASGWLWKHRCTVEDATASPGPAPTRVVADLSSQRKLQQGELFLVLESNPRAGTAFSVNVNGLIRVLFKR